MDGWIVIGTELDSKQLEKDLKNTEKKLQQFEKESEKLTKAKTKAEVDLQPYEEQKRIIQEMTDEMNKYAQSEADVNKNLAIENTQLEELNQKYSKQLNNLEQINLKIKENTKNQQLMKNKIEETNKKINQAKGFEGIKNYIDDAGKSMNKLLKKVSRWALAIIGVRTAYNAIRNAVSMVSSENEEVSNKLEYMSKTIANTLLPLVQGIVNWLYKIMHYVNYIANGLIGKELFDFSNTDRQLKNTQKGIDKIKKSLAGFDEMNVVNDTSTTSSSSSANAGLISNPFESMGEVETPGWLDSVIKFGQWVLENWEQVVGQLLLIKLVIDLLTGNWFGVVMDIVGFIVLGATQIWEAVEELGNSISLLWLQFTLWLETKVIQPIKVFFKDLWDKISKGASDMWDSIVNVFSSIGDWIYNNIIKPVGDFFSGLWKGVKDGATNLWNGIKSVFKTVGTWVYNNVISPISRFFGELWESLKAGPKGFANFVIDKIEWLINKMISGVNWLIKQLNKVSFDVPDWVPGIGGSKFGFNIGQVSEVKLPRLEVGGIISMPGRGVPLGYGQALGGERRREGVLPLTDSQAMEELGSAIGRYITVDLTNYIELDGRKIARHQTKIQSNMNFAMNK